MSSALVILAHPKLEQSRVNQRMYLELKALDNVVVHDLYEMYPNFFINVKHEQAAMEKASLIVFQHPFYWYSVPALLKEWLDQVLEKGWAYGEAGAALKGKTLLTATTTGATDQAYTHEGYNNFTMREFLRPFEQTANLCGMKYLEPFILHSARNSDDETILKHAQAYHDLIKRETDG
jgi:glutathione-regulated potassium-efflux system ancillary protein KefG